MSLQRIEQKGLPGMAQRVKPYVLKLTPREMIFLDDGLRVLIRHLKEIGLWRKVEQAEIALLRKKISDELKND